MSIMRSAFRITILISAFLTITYLGLNEVHTELAAWLVLIGSASLISAWASVWPGQSLEEMRIDRMAKRILRR